MTPLEAAARALHHELPGVFAWDQLHQSMRDAWLASARVALTAAVNAMHGPEALPLWATVGDGGLVSREGLLRALVGETSVSGNE